MILTKELIETGVNVGDILIKPFHKENLSPNSIDVTLNPELRVYIRKGREPLDVHSPNHISILTIPETGLVLKPGHVYIGCTNETAISKRYVPMFDGRSSMARLGIFVHISAGFGDLGWGYKFDDNGKTICTYPVWTIEITVVEPIRIYPNIRIGQVYFVEAKGNVEWYHGKYNNQKIAQTSLGYKDYEHGNDGSLKFTK